MKNSISVILFLLIFFVNITHIKAQLSLDPHLYPIVEDGKGGLITSEGKILYRSEITGGFEGLERFQQPIGPNNRIGTLLYVDESTLYQSDFDGKILNQQLLEADTIELFHYIDFSGKKYGIMTMLNQGERQVLEKKQFVITLKKLNEKTLINKIPSSFREARGDFFQLSGNYITYRIQKRKDSKNSYPSYISYITNLDGEVLVRQDASLMIPIIPPSANEFKYIKLFNSFLSSENSNDVVSVEGLLNKKQEAIVTPQDDIAIGYAGINDLFILGVPSGTKLINLKGDTLASYDVIKPFGDGLAIVESDNKFGAINEAGKVIVSIKYDYLSADPIGGSGRGSEKFENNVVVAQIENKSGLLDNKGKWIIEPEYQSIDRIGEDLYHLEKIDSERRTYYLYNLQNKSVSNLEHTGIIAIDQQVINYKLRNRDNSSIFSQFLEDAKLIPQNSESESTSFSKIRIPTKYTMAGYQSLDFIIVEENEKWHIFNLKTGRISDEGYENLLYAFTKDQDSLSLFIAKNEDQKWGLINENHEWLTEKKYHKINPFAGKLTIAMESHYNFEYLNLDGETVWKQPEDDKTALSEEDMERRFKNCIPSVYEEKPFGTTIYNYEILGPAKNGSGCRIRTTFTQNPNKDWEGKSMTCIYDNSGDFTEVIKDCMKGITEGTNSCGCKGELLDVIQNER